MERGLGDFNSSYWGWDPAPTFQNGCTVMGWTMSGGCMGVWPQLHQCVTHPGYDSRLSKACLKEDAEILEAEEQGNFKQRPFQSKPKLNKWKTLQVPSSQFFQTLPGNIILLPLACYKATGALSSVPHPPATSTCRNRVVASEVQNTTCLCMSLYSEI